MCMALQRVGSHRDDIPDPWYALEGKGELGGLEEESGKTKKRDHFEPGNRMNMIAFAGQQAGQAGRAGQDRTGQDRTEQGGEGQGTVTVTDQDPGSRKMSVVKGSEDENREGGGMDGSRVVKIFELDAAQDFVGLDWLCNGSHTAAATTGKGRRKKRSHISSWASDQAAATAKKPAAGAAVAAAAAGAGTVRQ